MWLPQTHALPVLLFPFDYGQEIQDKSAHYANYKHVILLFMPFIHDSLTCQ